MFKEQDVIDFASIRNASEKHRRTIGKVIIQIPCYNEAATLAVTLNDLPRRLPGVDVVEWLVVDDGSSDDTVEVAKANGVDHIVSHGHNLGLARAFETGIEAAIDAGADIIINTDADNQYCADDIPKLILPILNGADIVIGARPINDISHFSWHKKKLQNLGSLFIRLVSKTNIPDAPSGFRAISRSAAMQLNVFSDYTYTLETIIQAGQKGMYITSVEIRVNKDLRPSRLVSSLPSYIKRSVLTAFRIFITYRPFRFFAGIGGAVFLFGLLLGFRFLYFYMTGTGDGHIQSLILTSVLLLIGFQLCIVGVVADLISVNRKLLEKIDWRIKRLEKRGRCSNDDKLKTDSQKYERRQN